MRTGNESVEGLSLSIERTETKGGHMIDGKKRLYKLLKECRTYAEFETKAIGQSSWLLRPFVESGEIVNKPWLLNFWNVNKEALCAK